jgi:hypothetical protein
MVRIFRTIFPYCFTRYLGGTHEVNYRITDCDYIIESDIAAVPGISEAACKSIPAGIPVVITFDEVFPSGAEVINVPDGFKITKQTDGRHRVNGVINTAFIKNDITGAYSFNIWEGTITLMYSSYGLKQFNGPCVSYVHPNGNSLIAKQDSNLVVLVYP